MTKIFSFTRESPGTNNDGESQKRRIVMGYEYLVQMNILPRMDGKIPNFDAFGDNRYCVLSSPATHNLFHAVQQVNKAESVFVLITSLLRIGVEFKNIMLFHFWLMECHPKVQLLVIDEWGLDMPTSAMALATYHASLNSTALIRMNPGAFLSVSDEHGDLQKEVGTQALMLKQSWKIAKCLPDEIRATLQDNIMTNDVYFDTLLRNVRFAQRNGDSIEEAIQDFRDTLWPKTFSGDQQVANYIRTSCRTRSHVIDGIAIHQLSMCLAYYRNSPDYDPATEVVTFQDTNKKRGQFNTGLKCLLAGILDGRLGSVIIKSTNRISSRFSDFSTVLEICRQCGTKIHFAEMIGVDIVSAIRNDNERLVTMKQYMTAYHKAIDDRKQMMNAKDLEIRKTLQDISRCVVYSKRMKCDDFTFEFDEDWSEWTSVPGIGEDDDE